MFIKRVFELTDDEYNQIKKWDDIKTGHKCSLKPFAWQKDQKYVGAIGGSLSVIFTPTSIGTFVTIKCRCGAELNLRQNF